MNKIYAWVLLFLLPFSTSNLLANDLSIGVIGDSFSTGMLASPDANLDYQELLNKYSESKVASFNETSNNKPKVVRLWPSISEYKGVLPWIYTHLMQSMSMLYLDDTQKSWSFFLANKLNISPERIFLAAHDDASSYSAVTQLNRIITHNGGALPSVLFIFFTVFDICSSSVNFVTEAKTFSSNIESVLKQIYYIKTKKDEPGSLTEIILIPHLPLMQLPKTCDSLAELSPSSSMLKVFPFNPHEYCSTVFSNTSKGQKDNTSFLANRIREYRSVLKSLADKYKSKLTDESKTKLSFKYVNSLEDFTIDNNFLAKDCFHPSKDGHNMLASKIYETMSQP